MVVFVTCSVFVIHNLAVITLQFVVFIKVISCMFLLVLRLL